MNIETTEIDVVIAWVDGEDQTYIDKVKAYVGEEVSSSRDFEYKERFVCKDELVWCVFSVEKFMPWVRTIFIVTDGQDPFIKFPQLRKYSQKIKIIDHKVIYRGYEDALPTFSANSIETVLWRIPKLSENFIYFNDDMMVIRDVKKDDLVRNNLPVLNFHSRRPASRRKPEGFARYHYMMNTQKIMNNFFDHEPAYLPSHFPMAWSKSLFETLFECAREDMSRNIYVSTRGDYTRGFSPGMLHHNWLKAVAEPVINYEPVGIFVSGDENTESIQQKIVELDDLNRVFLCLNNFEKTQTEHPSFAERLRQLIGVPRAFG